MTYLDVNITSKSDNGAHGSTSDEIVLDVRLDNPDASRQTFDAFYLSEKEDQECYRMAIALQDWTRKCAFLVTKQNDTYRGITNFTRNLSDSGTKIQNHDASAILYIDNTPFPEGYVTSKNLQGLTSWLRLQPRHSLHNERKQVPDDV